MSRGTAEGGSTFTSSRDWPNFTCNNVLNKTVALDMNDRNGLAGVSIAPANSDTWSKIRKCCPSSNIEVFASDKGCAAFCEVDRKAWFPDSLYNCYRDWDGKLKSEFKAEGCRREGCPKNVRKKNAASTSKPGTLHYAVAFLMFTSLIIGAGF